VLLLIVVFLKIKGGMNVFGDRLRMVRKHSGLTQKALADKLFVSQQAVCKWEKNDSSPNPETVAKIAEICDVSVSYLLSQEEDEKKTAPGITSDGTMNENGSDVYISDDIKVAFFGGAAKDLTKEELDLLWKDAQRYGQFIIQQREQKKRDKELD